MKTPSLQKTLLRRCGCGVGVLLCILSVSIYLIVRHGLFRELDHSVTQTAALLSKQVELNNGQVHFEWEEWVGTNQALHDDGIFQFWNEATGSTTRSAQLRGKDLPKFCGAGDEPLLQEIQLPSGHQARAIGMRIYPFVLPAEVERMRATGEITDPKTQPYILVVARDTKSMYRVLNRLRWVLGVGTLLTLGVGFMLIQRVIAVTLRPIDKLTQQMEQRAEHQLDAALEVPRSLPVELVSLAGNFDRLLSRVASLRERERDFIRHAAHELRTPIAGLMAQTDLALSQPREAAAYAEHLRTCRKSAAELATLVKRLSALSRVGPSIHPLSLESLDGVSLLKECLQPFLPHFHDRGLRVTEDFAEPVLMILADRTLCKIIFTNLLDNAHCYAAAAGEILIKGSRQGGILEISIANPAEDLPSELDRLFEPLFRRDTSRTDAGVHLGIGLTLSQEAARVMGATLHVRKTEWGWIEFALKFPLSRVD
jgi:signal transduction histidine kinase